MTDELVKRLEAEADRLRADDVRAAHAMDDARDRIEALMAERQWQPIETAPKDGTDIIVLLTHMERPRAWTGRWHKGLKRWSIDHGMQRYQPAEMAYPTHWMPLPQPPTEGK